MSLALNRYENLLRPAYEGYAAIAWLCSAIVMFFVLIFTSLPKSAFFYMCVGCISMGGLRFFQARKILEYKLGLIGKPFTFMQSTMLEKIMVARPKDLWIGVGFEWEPKHTQRLYEIRKLAEKDLYPPVWYQRLRGVHTVNVVERGKPWIHALETTEKHLLVPLKTMEGNTAVFGTTGSGKTRFYETFLSQAILRNEVVFMIDPKGDKELKEIARQACIQAGREDAFLMFHPAHPSESIRLDCLRNWNNITEIASRISSLMPETGSGDFKAMAWDAINAASEAMQYVDVMPNLIRLRRCIQSGPDQLMEEVFTTFFERNIPNWKVYTAGLIDTIKKDRSLSNIQGSDTLKSYIYYYKNEVPTHMKVQAVDGLLAKVEHNREHLGKILSSLVPLLVQLTSGELGPMLSPDATDMNDSRAIFDSKKIISGRHVLYLGLDSLSNTDVGAQIGAMMLADLASVAGAIYNYEEPVRIQVVVDEAAEVVNIPLIQLLNKARGAGFVTTLASQTIADYDAKLGSEARTRQILGNCNNIICLRVTDLLTQQYFVDKLGEADIQKVGKSLAHGSQSESDGIDYRDNVGINLQEAEVSKIPAEVLGWLPDLHYIGQFAGGRVIKGRLPKLMN